MPFPSSIMLPLKTRAPVQMQGPGLARPLYLSSSGGFLRAAQAALSWLQAFISDPLVDSPRHFHTLQTRILLFSL